MPERGVFLSPAAENDALEQVRYLAVEDSEAAIQLIGVLQGALAKLARYPEIGRTWPTRRRELNGVRRLVLSGFPRSIFYRLHGDDIDVIRILHHRRDFPPEFDE